MMYSIAVVNVSLISSGEIEPSDVVTCVHGFKCRWMVELEYENWKLSEVLIRSLTLRLK